MSAKQDEYYAEHLNRRWKVDRIKKGKKKCKKIRRKIMKNHNKKNNKEKKHKKN